MEFGDVLRHRRMVRRFDRRPVPREVIDRIVDVGRRAPSAGFSQGLELLVLDSEESVAAFWELTRDPRFGWELDDIAVGPTVLVLPLPDARRYLEMGMTFVAVGGDTGLLRGAATALAQKFKAR